MIFGTLSFVWEYGEEDMVNGRPLGLYKWSRGSFFGLGAGAFFFGVSEASAA
jgi:hypothetical protein